MNAKANIQPVPTALDHLRAALATRDELGKQASEITAKIERLAPIEAEVALAQANLQKILDEDAGKLQAWADKGAKGEPPAVDSATREQASRRLADAKARLEAAGQVKGSLNDDLMAINGQLQRHRYLLGDALMNVLGEEALRTVESMRKATLSLLEIEQTHNTVMQQMQSLADQMRTDANGDTSTVARSFSNWLQARNDANRISNEERQRALQAGHSRALAALEKLQSGKDPDA